MSDILGVFDERNENDNLVEFLTKFTRFGIDQCLHLTYLIANKQRSIYQDKRVRNDFYLKKTIESISLDSIKSSFIGNSNHSK
jgi:hypothetical protein